MMFRHERCGLWLLGLSAAACVALSDLRAQCPDGSPPPCGVRRIASARPINPGQYIVVPFNNVTRASDVDWLRDGSVNLLTLEIGRWTDVQVVNDKRVGDLLRDIPATRRAQGLTLNDGLQLAKRAGAGMLVMGDFAKLGSGARLSANVFDVKTGKRVRSAEERIGIADSLLLAFGSLSRGVLALPAPADTRSGQIGTTSLDAYRAYLAGVRASNAFQLETADSLFAKALALDSTFALAHFQIAMLRMWGDAGVSGNSETQRHAVAAQRLGASLPPRERALINTVVDYAAGDYAKICDDVAPVVARDSSDVLALYVLGECGFHNHSFQVPANDTLPALIPHSYNMSLAALRRVLQLDPTYHVAFVHILDILKSPLWSACAPGTSGANCDQFQGVVLHDGDSLLIQPVSIARNSAAYWRQVARGAREKPMAANLALAQRIAEEWLASDPSSTGAATALAQVLVARGDIASADARLRGVKTNAFAGSFAALRMRIEIATKLGRGAEARAWFDSLVKAIPDQPATNQYRGSLDLAFGHAGRLTQGLLALPIYRSGGPEAAAYVRALPRMLLGLQVDDVGQLESAYWTAMHDSASCDAACHNRLWYSQVLELRAPRTRWPDYGPADKPLGFTAARALSRHDTVALRRAAFVYDSSARGNVAMLWQDFGWSTIGAEIYLALGDSTKALNLLRFSVDTAMMLTPNINLFRNAISMQAVWPRVMLQRAELAAALKHPEEARTWYDRVLDLWATADAEFQPDIARIKTARAALGSSSLP